jgi:hypothetical protein
MSPASAASGSSQQLQLTEDDLMLIGIFVFMIFFTISGPH